MIARRIRECKLPPRNRHGERGALADGALDGEVAAMVLHDLLGQREPEPATALLRREERVEQPRKHLGSDAYTGVFDFDHHTIARTPGAHRHLAATLARRPRSHCGPG